MSVLTISTSWKPKSGYPMSDWNIVWLDDTEWVPGDDLIVAYGALPHGFCRLEPTGTQNEHNSF